ncbi:MAG: ATP-binding cassette domain-containing protein [Candidatus Methanoplasma sp.]|jgi:ATP-binding cassette subfamily C protein|nr:ATP-binding cassette domain-containing protein [Candidatus Methanoplasma sp.]
MEMKVASYVKKYRLQVAILVAFSIISAISSVVVPYLNGMFIDVLITTASADEIVRFAFIIIAIGLFGAFASYICNMSVAKLTSKTSFDMMSDAIGHVQKIPYDKFISKFNPAYLIQRLSTDVGVLLSFFINNFISIFIQIATFAVTVYVMMAINLQILFISLAFLPIYLLCYMYLKKPMLERNIRYKEDSNHFSKTMFEQINRVHEIKAEASFEKSREIEKKSFSAYFGSMIGFSRISYLFTSLDGLIGVVFQSIVLIIGGIQIINGNMTIGEFTIVNTYFFMLLNVIKYFFNLGKSYQDYKASRIRMEEILSIEKENNGDREVSGISLIKITDASYSYVDDGPLVTDGFSAEFKKGRISLVLGPNGSGKTTLINILLGILQNLRNGKVEYDGVNVSEIDLYSARKDDIAVLLQRSDSPDSTVEEYLQDCLELDRNEIISMIRLMGLESIFAGKNFNIDKYWDSKIANISGGERQKVMLLRTLGKGRNTIVLDEPSAGLDDFSIESLLKYLSAAKADKIIVIISHDLRFRDYADDIIMVNPVQNNNSSGKHASML